MLDVIIVGGGPAGLTAGLYAARSGLKAMLFEGEFAGGQASTTDRLENYPGFPKGVGGPELMLDFEEQAKGFGLSIMNAEVTSLSLAGDVKRVTADDVTYESRTVILAMGAKRRELGIPGESMNIGRGVSYCATCDGAFYRGKTVAVIGGGDTAIEDALYLARASKVYLIHRRDKLRAQGNAVERALNDPNITPVLPAKPMSIERTDAGLTLKLDREGNESELRVDGVFIAVGTRPITELVKTQLTLDEAGYIEAGETTETGISGVFAAGDIRRKPLKQVLTAASDGAVAAHMAAKFIDS